MAPDAPPLHHDHYPRDDLARRRAMAAAARQLADGWQTQDTVPGGMIHAMRAWSDAGQPDAPDRLFAALMPWLRDLAWLDERLDAMLALSRADAFAQPPLRAFGKGNMGGLVLAEHSNITLTLMLHSHGEQAAEPPHSAVFTAGHGLTRVVRAGGAAVDHYRLALTEAERMGVFVAAEAAPCTFAGQQRLTDGAMLRVDQQCESFNIVGASGDVLLLQLYVQSPSCLPMREYDLATGRLIRAAAPDRVSSFRLMNLALLRSMGRRDAVPVFVRALAEGDFSSRWQALRELVALDTAAALPHVAAMAEGDPHPEVRRAAAATLDLINSRITAQAANAKPAATAAGT